MYCAMPASSVLALRSSSPSFRRAAYQSGNSFLTMRHSGVRCRFPSTASGAPSNPLKGETSVLGRSGAVAVLTVGCGRLGVSFGIAL